MHPSVAMMWQAFREFGASPSNEWPHLSHCHFCDNQQDADECARLVVAGRKRATAPSLWSLKSRDEKLPRAGDLHVITNWVGEAQCIIRITGMEVLPFAGLVEGRPLAVLPPRAGRQWLPTPARHACCV